MANTNMDTNKTSNTTWIVLGIIILAVILYFVFRTTGDKNEPVNEPGTSKATTIDEAQKNRAAPPACVWLAKA